MKYILSVMFLFVWLHNASAIKPLRYKVHIVTWENERVTGRVDAITDSSISIKTNNGKIFTFSAVQTKNLKIWKPGINLPATIVGAVIVPIFVKQLIDSQGRDDWGLAGFVAIIVGVPIGSIAGLTSGDWISTKYNQRRMRAPDFKLLRIKLET